MRSAPTWRLRPDLRRIYLAIQELDLVRDLLEPLRFTELPGPTTEIDGAPFHHLCLELGPRSVDGWLADLVASELALPTGPQLDVDAQTLRLADREVPLTQLELKLLRCLVDRGGRAVPRAELLRDVWGHRWEGGGNVIEVAVHGIRRKLGDDADLVETVRGVGYRWRGE
jgi:hypothetical protein